MQIKVKGIISFPHLFTARAADPSSDPKFSVTVLLHESDPQLAAVRQVVDTEKANGFPTGFPESGKSCLVQSKTAPGYWEIRTATGADHRPPVVDKNMQPVIDPGNVVAGDIAWVAFNTYPYNKAMSKGVAAGLNAVMLTGELGPLGRLDNRPSVESLFGDVASAPAPAPSTIAPPAAPAPSFIAPPPAPPSFIMTPAAQGVTREAYHQAGWTDDQLVANGLMLKN